MKRVVVYPGSFDPFHEGHLEIVYKASQQFDKIILAVGHNPDKEKSDVDKVLLNIKESLKTLTPYNDSFEPELHDPRIEIQSYCGPLSTYISEMRENLPAEEDICGLVRGLRNTNDFIYEQSFQYHNEDLGLNLPIVFYISSRYNVHISSSALRHLQKSKNQKI